MTKRLRPTLTLILAALLAVPAKAAPAPRVPIASFDQLPQPLPLPYGDHADADAAVAAARARAIAGHKLLLIDLGGNWCLDCRLLAGTIALPAMKRWLAARFEIVTVDVGRFDKNLHIPARFGAPGRPEGVPALLVIEPRSGRLINKGRIAALADARAMTPQALADWLALWVR